MSFLRFAFAVVAGLSGCACSSQSLYGPPTGCEGKHCVANPAGGSNPTTSSGGGVGGAGGAAGASDVLGTVHRITSPSFSDTQTLFNAAATVEVLPQDGAAITTPYGGAAGTSFTLPGVPPGRQWFLVNDETNGGADILSTISQYQVPALSSLSLPVIDLGMMQNIANSLPSLAATGVSTLGSQIVLLLSHANGPYAGVSVTGGAGGAHIVYDLGNGNYTDSGTVTGGAGTVILFNSGLAGLSIINVTDAALAKVYAVSVLATTGAATLVAADLE